MGRAMCTEIGTVTWVHFQFFFWEKESDHEYGTEHTRRSISMLAPNIDIQPGRKERIHIQRRHKQDTGNS